MTADRIGYDQVENGYVHLNHCTDQNKAHCERRNGGNVIINPIRSARLSTINSFAFKYGRVEVIMKIPKGKWITSGLDTISILFSHDIKNFLFSYLFSNTMQLIA